MARFVDSFFFLSPLYTLHLIFLKLTVFSPPAFLFFLTSPGPQRQPRDGDSVDMSIHSLMVVSERIPLNFPAVLHISIPLTSVFSFL